MRFLKKISNTYFKKTPQPLQKIEDCSTLNDSAFYLINKHGLNDFCFLEIGVFKGDNAITLIHNITKQHAALKVNYIGFDLFDDIDHLEQHYPEDFKQYGLEAYPYWEFKSGGHTYSNVIRSLTKVLDRSEFQLIKGDTTETLDAFFKTHKSRVDLVYIDGCHDYKVVKSDWQNCAGLFKLNPELIIVLDDFTYEGVKNLYDDIITENKFIVRIINPNQLMVSLN